MSQYVICHNQYTVNDEKLAGLKFGESANESVWQKKVWRIHPEFEYVCMYGWIIVFLQLVLEKDSTIHRIRLTLVLPIFIAYRCMSIISIAIINIKVLMFCLPI